MSEHSFIFEYEIESGFYVEGTAELVPQPGDETEFSIGDITLRSGRLLEKDGPQLYQHLRRMLFQKLSYDPKVEEEWAEHLEREGHYETDPHREHRTFNHAMTGVAA